MATRSREREVKFEVSPDLRLPALEDFAIQDEIWLDLRATYWDTPNMRLLGWGHTLRHRWASDGSEDGWTLKIALDTDRSGSTIDRDEIHVAGAPTFPPPSVCDLVSGVVRGKGLVPVATIHTRRHQLVVGKASEAVELSDDRVVSLIGGESGPTFRQVEVEVREDGPDSRQLLEEISERVIAAGADFTADAKLQRALGVEPAPEVAVPQLGPDSTVADLVRSVFAGAAARIISHDPAVRLGSSPEAVHQARVATRRLRSDLRTLRPLMEFQSVDSIRAELAWLGVLLGSVRDLDVIIAGIEEHDDWVPPYREARAAITRALSDERRRKHLELVDAMSSGRYKALLNGLVRDVHELPVTSSAAGQPAAEALPPLIRQACRRMERAVSRLDDDPSDPELHEIRKRAKRARYAAELAHGIVKRGPDRLAKRLTSLQDCLGTLQDTVVAEEHLRTTAARLGGEPAYVAGTFVCLEKDARDTARKTWRELWKAARKKSLRRWLR